MTSQHRKHNSIQIIQTTTNYPLNKWLAGWSDLPLSSQWKPISYYHVVEYRPCLVVCIKTTLIALCWNNNNRTYELDILSVVEHWLLTWPLDFVKYNVKPQWYGYRISIKYGGSLTGPQNDVWGLSEGTAGSTGWDIGMCISYISPTL